MVIGSVVHTSSLDSGEYLGLLGSFLGKGNVGSGVIFAPDLIFSAQELNPILALVTHV